MRQSLQGATFHVGRIIPRSLGGRLEIANLAWACPSGNLHKSNRVEVLVSDYRDPVPLLNPRTDEWSDHFRWEGDYIIGLTPVGRATVDALLLNHQRRVKIRQAEA